MKRAALGVLVCLAAACGVTDVKLENFPRPFACDRGGGDGGAQCATGWTCGYDDRCFERAGVLDGGQHVEQWQCATDDHCPDGWHCGQEVSSRRNCQQLGVGAPSPCLDDDAGCQGGWRCAATERCFDPTDTSDAGTRPCTRDGECPNDFRCGQKVGLEQLCIQRNVRATSPCTSDEGCEGGNRCDTVAQRCLTVTDVITTGRATVFGAQELNPRLHEPPPLQVAVSRFATVPPSYGNPTATDREGLVFASLFDDGGLRVWAQLREDQRADGGPSVMLFEKRFALTGAAADVTDLVLSLGGPVVRYADAGTFRGNLAGAWDPLPPSDFLRQREPLVPNASSELLLIAGNSVFQEDGGRANFPGPVLEAFMVRGIVYALTAGALYASDGGTPLQLLDAGAPLSSSRGAVAGTLSGLPPGRIGFFADVALGGGFAIASYTETPMGWLPGSTFSGCPDGGRPLQMSFDEERPDQPQLFARCGTPASSFPVKVLVQGVGPGSRADFELVVEDQVPFQTGLVAQRGSPFVRAHGGADGRFWYAPAETDQSLLGKTPLRALLLDRQPDAMISFRDADAQSVRVFAEASGTIFVREPNGGFVSQLGNNNVVPLSYIPGQSNWIVANNGVLDGNGNKPRFLASLPAGVVFVPPASGASFTLDLAGQARTVIVVASGDSVWIADVTDAQSGPFAQPALFSRALVPVPGVPLRSLVLDRSSSALAGYLTTSTRNLKFSTTDLVVWRLDAVSTPSLPAALPLEVWAEADGGAGRTGFSDGVVWSLPIMVELTQPLRSTDGGALPASDFARKCGDLFATTSEGLFHATKVNDGGLPAWVPVTLPVTLDSTRSLRLYETTDDVERLFLGTQSGQLVELNATCQ